MNVRNARAEKMGNEVNQVDQKDGSRGGSHANPEFLRRPNQARAVNEEGDSQNTERQTDGLGNNSRISDFKEGRAGAEQQAFQRGVKRSGNRRGSGRKNGDHAGDEAADQADTQVGGEPGRYDSLAGIRSRLKCKNFGPANSGRDEQNGQQ